MAKNLTKTENNYDSVLTNVAELLEQARRLSARSVNAIMTATYWEIGRQIVEVEQNGEERADYYGKEIVNRLAIDLTNSDADSSVAIFSKCVHSI
jgi:CRISPR/Cas system-associated endonuclease Cas1